MGVSQTFASPQSRAKSHPAEKIGLLDVCNQSFRNQAILYTTSQLTDPSCRHLGRVFNFSWLRVLFCDGA